MRISLRIALLGLLAIPALLLGADKLHDALAGLRSKDTATYEKAADYLVKHPQEAREPLKNLLLQQNDKDKDAAVARFRAARLLGELKDQDSAEVLKTALFSGQETNAAVRVEIIRALAKLGRKDVIIAYSNSGLEKSPAVSAAIALALQGNTDDDSKTVLGRLLSSNDNEQVSRAAVFAISKVYQANLSNPQNTFAGKSSDLSKISSARGKLAAPPPPPPDKKEPTRGDKVIFAALKEKREGKTDAIGKKAAALLQELYKTYKQE